jgi:transcriptional regulator with XRE-family HTH domain
MTGNGIGARIRQLRTERIPRLTQRELAERSGVSVDLISKLEQGTKQSALLVTLHKIALALDVDISALVGHATRVDTDQDDSGLLAIRRAIISARDDGEPSNDDELQRSATLGWGHYWTHRFDVLGAMLPTLITTGRASVRNSGSPHAYAALADAYNIASCMLVHLGKVDLGYLAMERALAAANLSDDELRVSALSGWMSWVLLHHTGGSSEAKHIAVREADSIEPKMKGARPEQVSVWGSLLISAAVAAAREDNASEADDLINLAEVAATRLDGMGYSPRMYNQSPFGLPLIIMQTVDISVVTGRPGRALTVAERMPPNDMPLASKARHLADKAFAYTELGKVREAENTLYEIRRQAPNWMRYQSYPRVIVAELWEREKRARSTE